MERPPTLAYPWSRPFEEILHFQQVSLDHGLDDGEASARKKRYGPNSVQIKRSRSAWRILVNQFANVIVLLLAAAAGVSLIYGDRPDAFAIAIVILLNALIGFVTELRATRSMEALAKLSLVKARVQRGARTVEVPAADLVPGDIVILEAGDVVSADLRIARASKLQADESRLTGESAPVHKHTNPVSQASVLGDRSNMLYKGTVVTRGSGTGVVVATGKDTEIGVITGLVEEAERGKTPLEVHLDRLGQRLIWLTLGIACIVSIGGVLAGRDLLLMIKTGVALAVAAIPEGLPIVATMTLAQGMWWLARRNALVQRLSAVETLGATSVIVTDKTGTLTENRMAVTKFWLPSGEFDLSSNDAAALHSVHDSLGVREALELGALCNNASLGEGDSTQDGLSGDPLEIALLSAAAGAGVHRAELEGFAEDREEAFDPETKIMATYHRTAAGYRVAVKGAPEVVLRASDSIRTAGGKQELLSDEEALWAGRNQEMAQDGLRVLALATKLCKTLDDPPYEGLTFVGLVGMQDPPRPGVSEVLDSFRKAGVRVIMATGDHAGTAVSVAQAVGLAAPGTVEVIDSADLDESSKFSPAMLKRLGDARIFARVSPRQKLDIIRHYQEAGDIVAMTGDGVNDAPALKKADIGIAMGQRGTDVAREAADMVLKDDSMGTIAVAIGLGRVIFGNIRKFVVYLLSCNMSEVLTVGLFAVTPLPLPILPLQILFLNLLTDVFPALALGMGKGEKDILLRPPRPSNEKILTRKHWLAIAIHGCMLTAAVLGAFTIAVTGLDMTAVEAVTISFLTLGSAQLVHVFNMTERESGFLRNEVTENPYVWAALALCIGLLLFAVYQPAIAQVLRLSPPGGLGWSVVVIMALFPLVLTQAVRGAVRFGARRAGMHL